MVQLDLQKNIPYVKIVYVSSMSRDLPQLWQRIVEAVAAIYGQILQRVWQELDYKIDICHVTKGGYIDHL